MAFDLSPLNSRDDSFLLGFDQVHENFSQSISVHTSTMTGHETFTPNGGSSNAMIFRAVLDPNGADRNYNPSGTFPAGYTIIVKNIGTTYNIIIDSTGSAITVTPGETVMRMYDGTDW